MILDEKYVPRFEKNHQLVDAVCNNWKGRIGIESGESQFNPRSDPGNTKSVMLSQHLTQHSCSVIQIKLITIPNGGIFEILMLVVPAQLHVRKTNALTGPAGMRPGITNRQPIRRLVKVGLQGFKVRSGRDARAESVLLPSRCHRIIWGRKDTPVMGHRLEIGQFHQRKSIEPVH